VDKAEVDALRAKLKDVESQGESSKAQASQALLGVEKLQAQTQEKLQTLQTQTTHIQDQVERLQSEAALRAKAADEAEKARSEDREAQREEARLLKQLVEDLQEGQKRLETQLAAVDKKAETKRLDDQELRDSLTLMRKDLRDNAQDVSVLKQKVEKLMAPEKSNAKPLDKALGSKWLPGAAVLLAIGAVAIAASK
jgi:chromosome segregation ATPase